MLKTKTTIKSEIPGLLAFNSILTQEYQKAGNNIGKQGVRLITRIQRKDTGQERSRTRYRIKQRVTLLNVEFFNSTIQAAVDETGAKPHFPPYKAGSKLYSWVSRKGLAPRPSRQTRQAASKGLTGVAARVAANKDSANRVKALESISFLIARAISRRGLPRPGDPLRKPFETAKKQLEPFSAKEISRATQRAITRINGKTGKTK